MQAVYQTISICVLFINTLAIVMAIRAGLAAGLPYFAVAATTSLLFGMCLNV